MFGIDNCPQGNPSLSPGSAASLLGRGELELALGLSLPVLQESTELAGREQPSTLCPYKAWWGWGLILAPEAPAGQGAR